MVLLAIWVRRMMLDPAAVSDVAAPAVENT
jgi:hypothetical protein